MQIYPCCGYIFSLLRGNDHCNDVLSLPVMDGSLIATLTGSGAPLGDSLPVFSHFLSQKKAFRDVLLC